MQFVTVCFLRLEAILAPLRQIGTRIWIIIPRCWLGWSLLQRFCTLKVIIVSIAATIDSKVCVRCVITVVDLWSLKGGLHWLSKLYLRGCRFIDWRIIDWSIYCIHLNLICGCLLLLQGHIRVCSGHSAAQHSLLIGFLQSSDCWFWSRLHLHEWCCRVFFRWLHIWNPLKEIYIIQINY